MAVNYNVFSVNMQTCSALLLFLMSVLYSYNSGITKGISNFVFVLFAVFFVVFYLYGVQALNSDYYRGSTRLGSTALVLN